VLNWTLLGPPLPKMEAVADWAGTVSMTRVVTELTSGAVATTTGLETVLVTVLPEPARDPLRDPEDDPVAVVVVDEDPELEAPRDVVTVSLMKGDSLAMIWATRSESALDPVVSVTTLVMAGWIWKEH